MLYKVLLKLRPYIEELFNRRTFTFLKYHNFSHTEKVVERCIEIAKAAPAPLTEEEFYCLITAAWFHDTGHLFNELKEHEQAGVDLMAAFMKSFSIDEVIIEIIANCILATKFPSNPKTELERIICDADTFHFGTREFINTDPTVYAEMEERLNIHIENKIQKSIKVLESHHYYTSYCQHLLDDGKKDNIAYFRRLLSTSQLPN